eukprot:TRINITY_DN18427_c0_g1_i1.p1 TRINITY_DN18427_c0_g1~~TRINITY_DN18427_c0_g1_i1.p1  ORF type:complete len:524 (+),score=177.92 TRINITY_DN18427_c0_g1_i1:24-1574(+)
MAQQPGDGTCKFFLKNKSRFCKFERYQGGDFCVHHTVTTPNGQKRVPCPLDSRHTIFEKDVERHVATRCPALKRVRELQKQPYYRLDANLGSHSTPAASSSSVAGAVEPAEGTADDEHGDVLQDVDASGRAVKRRRLQLSPLYAVGGDRFAALVAKLEAAHGSLLAGNIGSAVLDHAQCRLAAASRAGAGAQRHVDQESSLIGHLERLKLLDKRNTFVEFGCGKGELSVLLHQACGVPVTMLDRTTALRNKADHRATVDREQLRRLTLDIKDLHLPGLLPDGQPLVGFSKHLCGEAADLTVRAVHHLLLPSPPTPPEAEGAAAEPLEPDLARFAGLVMATCCHHKCTWSNYANPKFMRDTVGLSPDEFGLLTNMSGWATARRSALASPAANLPPTAATTNPTAATAEPAATAETAEPAATAATAATAAAESQQQQAASEAAAALAADAASTGASTSGGAAGLSWSRKEQLGFMAKRLMDYGRVVLLRELGLDAELVYYATQEATPENCLMYAVKPG